MKHRLSAAAPTPWAPQRILMVLVAIMGIGVLLYPSAASWFSDRKHATEVNGYVHKIQSMSPEENQAMLEEAREYNENLPSGPLRDPYSLGPDGRQTAIGDGTAGYFKALKDLPGEMMGRVRIPTLDVDLPIFHGTDAETLAKGVGHLYGTALPLGGEGNHSALTAHSGFVNATLFTHLGKLVPGDVFSVTVLSEVMYYEVDQILTVLPNEAEALRRERGIDYVTLVTCTPTGVNTHRLLVRGHRIDSSAAQEAGVLTLPSDTTDPGFPWWLLGLVASVAAVVLMTRPGNLQDAGESAPQQQSIPVGSATAANSTRPE